MKTSAIIAEYNPFHNGHAYHITQTRHHSEDKIIVIMSGNFVQRGEPAIIDKWARTQMALRGGADIVLELPVFYALSSSQEFALGAINILQQLNCVDTLSFGAETADISLLQQIQTVLEEEPSSYRSILSSHIREGNSFPKAQSLAITQYMGPLYGDIVSKPNNILALEYLRALHQLNSPIKPMAIPRLSSYGSVYLEENYSSALAIRSEILSGRSAWKKYIYPEDLPLFSKVVKEDSLFPLLIYHLRTQSSSALQQIRDIREGLEHRLIRAARQATCYSELLSLSKTKRFTMARIKRIFLNILLNISNDLTIDIRSSQLYARVLGIKRESLPLLSFLSQHAHVPIITKLPPHISHPSLSLDLRASELYAAANTPALPGARDYTHPLIIF